MEARICDMCLPACCLLYTSMTIEAALPWLREHKDELIGRIERGKYTPSPVRRVEIPKPDGGIRKLGIPTVIDRIIQQAIAQKLMPIYEPMFSDGSYGYRPGRNAKDAIERVREYAEEGYRYAVSLDLSRYFDTLNHEILLNRLRKEVKDERVIQIIKRYLKSGVMENGVVMDTEEGSPQGGNLSPLLANIYLDEFDKEFERRGVPCVRYADDIVLLAKSERAAKRLLETSTSYLENKLKLTVNRKKSKVASVYAIRNFKFLGFALGRNGNGTFMRVHPKSWKKMKAKLKSLSSRRHVQSVIPALCKIREYMRGWLNYYGIAAMKQAIEELNGWLYHRIRMCIWTVSYTHLPLQSKELLQGAFCMMLRSGEFWRKEMPKKQKVKKEKKKKQYRNKTGEMLFDYVKTNRQYTEENRRRQEEEGVKTKGLKDLNTMEKTCIVIIVLGVIGLVVKYAIL